MNAVEITQNNIHKQVPDMPLYGFHQMIHRMRKAGFIKSRWQEHKSPEKLYSANYDNKFVTTIMQFITGHRRRIKKKTWELEARREARAAKKRKQKNLV
jgi:DNA-binding PadR family transcriptional regulator